MKDRSGQVWENDCGVVVLVLGPTEGPPGNHRVVVIHDPLAGQNGRGAREFARTTWGEAVLDVADKAERGLCSLIYPGRPPKRLG